MTTFLAALAAADFTKALLLFIAMTSATACLMVLYAASARWEAALRACLPADQRGVPDAKQVEAIRYWLDERG